MDNERDGNSSYQPVSFLRDADFHEAYKRLFLAVGDVQFATTVRDVSHDTRGLISSQEWPASEMLPLDLMLNAALSHPNAWTPILNTLGDPIMILRAGGSSTLNPASPNSATALAKEPRIILTEDSVILLRSKSNPGSPLMWPGRFNLEPVFEEEGDLSKYVNLPNVPDRFQIRHVALSPVDDKSSGKAVFECQFLIAGELENNLLAHKKAINTLVNATERASIIEKGNPYNNRRFTRPKINSLSSNSLIGALCHTDRDIVNFWKSYKQ